MLDRFDDRTLEIATVVVVVLIALVLLCYLAIFINPWVPFNLFQPPTRTPIAIVTPVVVPTWTPSPTPTATSTATPTPTWTPSPTPTNTPLPTATNTSTPLPTDTSTPLPPKPTARPPRPTATPTPWPYDWVPCSSQGCDGETGQRPDCERTWVKGWVYGADGLPEAGVQMRVGNDQGWRADTWTDVDGYYAFEFAKGPKAGKWFVRVFKGDQPRSEQFWWTTTAGCNNPRSIQAVQIVWEHR